ncbi:MAG: 5,6-dimethylbenzimidazole synthase [candidate division WS2 bacterium]|uniref:5,6-dimethylbenzimidazole synthase n=1 Tax=Psychracetigena formicireducens TaxID=2986056 RepID=A0A9E2BFW2_PSYF1|nr:5,6-dimethylbenzimidazole synthase [Candidatus Psychracetigena formicireducens]MBT9144833.1 5,6-dimethylbenzimidazole synthase [Candidatus Psychracetigena formicireducens]MBT9150647.1 5,6-dimethylbenzimidazole synthase [Candidatus Psychracetigena formicireducens]
MEVREAILKRRSIRKFNPEPIDKEIITKILEAGHWAPSEGNLQPWFFYVVENIELRKALAKAALNQEFIIQAPVAIVVCADLEKTAPYGKRGKELFCLQSTAAAIQNMLLFAYSLGIGSCWVGAFNEAEAQLIMNLPANLRPLAIIPLGYPAETGRARRTNLNDKIKWMQE